MSTEEHQKNVIEAIIFASDKPVTIDDIMEFAGKDVDVGKFLVELQNDYKDRGIHLFENNGRWAFRTSPDLKDILKNVKPVEKALSRSALETLAIIAYHQPITRTEIENIRGIATNKGTLDILIEAGFIKPGRRRDTPGRPLTWITTNEFLDHFSLGSIMDLPGVAELKASGLLDSRPAIEAIPDMDDLFEETDDEDDKPLKEESA